MPGVTITRDPRGIVVGVLLLVSVFAVVFVWPVLSWHARGMILAGYGITLLLVGLIPARRTRRLLTSGVRSQGAVVGAKEDASRAQDDPTAHYYHPVVRFTALDGREVEFTSAVGYDIAPQVGDPVPVRYRPDDPEQAELDQVITWALPALVGLLGGLGLAVAGVVVYLHE